jgi:hypothetical protein
MKSTSIWLTLLAAMTVGGFFLGKGCKPSYVNDSRLEKYKNILTLLEASPNKVIEPITFQSDGDSMIKRFRSEQNLLINSRLKTTYPNSGYSDDTNIPISERQTFTGIHMVSTDLLTFTPIYNRFVDSTADTIRFAFAQHIKSPQSPNLARLKKYRGKTTLVIFATRYNATTNRRDTIQLDGNKYFDIMTLCPYDCN